MRLADFLRACQVDFPPSPRPTPLELWNRRLDRRSQLKSMGVELKPMTLDGAPMEFLQEHPELLTAEGLEKA